MSTEQTPELTFVVSKPHRFNVKHGTPCGWCPNALYVRDEACTVTITDAEGHVMARELAHRDRCAGEMLESWGLSG